MSVFEPTLGSRSASERRLGPRFLVFGLLVRPAAAALAFTMLVAIFAVHFGKGFFLDKGGYEYALALFAASVSLLFSGGGRYAADAALAPRVEGAR